jgi:phage head maturation protease
MPMSADTVGARFVGGMTTIARRRVLVFPVVCRGERDGMSTGLQIAGWDDAIRALRVSSTLVEISEVDIDVGGADLDTDVVERLSW